MTTFSRLALVIQGKCEPCNWIETAFLAVVNALKLPTVGSSNKGKFLHTTADDGDLEWISIVQLPEITESDKGKYLHLNADTGDLEWAALPEANAAEATSKRTVSKK